MGLDQYWVRHNPVEWYNNWELSGADWNSYAKAREGYELYYHRKVPALQAFMRTIWEEQGGTHEGDEWGDRFNGSEAYVVVTEAILRRLELACWGDGLDTEARGFFWGQHEKGDIKYILEAVKKAREELNKGSEVYYYSSW